MLTRSLVALAAAAVFAVSVLSVLRAPRAVADEPPAAAPTAALVAQQDAFLLELCTGDPDKAYRTLLAGSPVLDQAGALVNLVAQTRRGLELYGRPSEWRTVTIEPMDANLVHGRAIVCGKQAPLFFYFTWYRESASGTWRIIQCNFNDQVAAFVSSAPRR